MEGSSEEQQQQQKGSRQHHQHQDCGGGSSSSSSSSSSRSNNSRVVVSGSSPGLPDHNPHNGSSRDAPSSGKPEGGEEDEEGGKRGDLGRAGRERSDFCTGGGSSSVPRGDPNPQDSGRDHNVEKGGAGGGSAAAAGGGDVSLREWLDKPERAVEELECLHIFRQIVEMVSAAHSEGVVVSNVRPSCFVMSTFNRVSFIESASCSTSGSGSASCEDEEDEEGGSDAHSGYRNEGEHAGAVREEKRGGEDRGGGTNEGGGGRKAFPLKQLLLMEFNWYTSPEEAAGGTCSFASDIYQLGVLLFELFCTFSSMEEKLRTMSNLRHRLLPPQLLLKWPKEASFCLWLLHPQPNTRPKMSEVLKSEFLNEPRDDLEEREAATKLREEIEDQELLLEFLLQLQQRKQDIADKLQDAIHYLSSDIEAAAKNQLLLKKGGSFLVLNKHEMLALEKEEHTSSYPGRTEDSASFGSRKRFRQGLQNNNKEESHNHKGLRSETQPKNKEDISSKSSRLMKNFKKFESVYFQMRCKMISPSGRGPLSRTEGSSVDNFVCKGSHGGTKSEWLNPFLEGLCKYLSFSKLKVRADLKQGDLLNSSNLVCSLGFDRDKDMFATAGVNRKIKIFECDIILNEDRDIHYPVAEMASRSRISSICWNSYIKNQIASSDFEGIVQVWDVTRSQSFVEMREHEKRVWCVDFSLADPTKLASGSDDGTVKLWNINQAGSVGTIRAKANVCSVQFAPNSGYSLAIGSADHKVYYYDLRNARVPLRTLVGHTKTVSYVKFVDSSTLVSASTDNSLKLWDLSMNSSRVENPLQTFTGHTNVKNFVGLSICDGYIATGSETNEVFVYHKAFPMPVLSFKFNNTDSTTEQEVDDSSQFISCVCWRAQSSILVAASSSGDIKLLEMV